MKKIITLIICIFSGIVIAKADICYSGGQIDFKGEIYCLGVRYAETYNAIVYSASIDDNIVYITLSEKELKENNQIKEIEKTVDGRTFKVDDINIDLEVGMYIPSDQSFVVGPNGEDVIWEETIDPAIGVFNEKFKITDYTNVYNSKNTYIVYEDKNCINKNAEGEDRYLNCELVLEMKPKFVVNILRDYDYDNYNCKENDSTVGPTNPEAEEKCEEVKCAEPLTFVDYLIIHNPLLITIILLTVILITISVIFIVKYKKLKKNINK